MYLNKKVLSIPIANHYEQLSNAAALEQLGVKVITKIDQNFQSVFTDWIEHTLPVKLNLEHSTKEIVDHLIIKTTNNNQ